MKYGSAATGTKRMPDFAAIPERSVDAEQLDRMRRRRERLRRDRRRGGDL